MVVIFRVQKHLRETYYGKALEYMDTHKDRQVLKAVMATLTSTQFTAKLQGISGQAQSQQYTNSVIIDN